MVSRREKGPFPFWSGLCSVFTLLHLCWRVRIIVLKSQLWSSVPFEVLSLSPTTGDEEDTCESSQIVSRTAHYTVKLPTTAYETWRWSHFTHQAWLQASVAVVCVHSFTTQLTANTTPGLERKGVQMGEGQSTLHPLRSHFLFLLTQQVFGELWVTSGSAVCGSNLQPALPEVTLV